MTTTRYSIVPTLKSVTPVTAGLTYIGQVRVAVDISGRNCYAKFYWYDANYKYISTTLGSAVVSTGAFAWQMLTVSAAAPATAAYAGVVPEIQDPTGGNVCEYFIDRHKISTSLLNTPGPRAWQPPRQITITLEPNAINEMQNPGFGDPSKPLWGWAVSGTKTTMAVNPITLHDSNSMDMTVSGIVPGDLPGQLCFGAHTISSTALYPGSDVNPPPITTLQPDTDYTISLWVSPRQGYLPIRISFNDGAGEYVGTASPVTNVWQVATGQWYQLSVQVHTSPSNTGSGRVSVGYFSSDLTAMSSPVEPDTPGQSAWTPWANPPAQYKGIWQSTSSYVIGDVVAIADGTGPPGANAYFATALAANTNINPVTDVGQATWQRFNLYQTGTLGVTTTTPNSTPFYLDGYWTNLTRYRGDKIGLGVEYPAGSGSTYCMVQPSTIFGGFGELPMETHEFLVDQMLVQKGRGNLTFFDGDIPSPDYLWEGNRYNSRSYFYQSRRGGQERLQRIITNYVPFNTPIEIQFSQQAVIDLWPTS